MYKILNHFRGKVKTRTNNQDLSLYFSYISDVELATRLSQFNSDILCSLNIGTLVVTNPTILARVLETLCTQFSQMSELIIQNEVLSMPPGTEKKYRRNLLKTQIYLRKVNLQRVIVYGCFVSRCLPELARKDHLTMIRKCNCLYECKLAQAVGTEKVAFVS
jgi:hypothetical protein